jgi:hypothetical protein
MSGISGLKKLGRKRSSLKRKRLTKMDDFEVEELLRIFGLGDWKVDFLPNSVSEKEGEILLKNKRILIYCSKEDPRAKEILLHELLEIKLQKFEQSYISILNVLIEALTKQLYQAKEDTINDLVASLTKAQNLKRKHIAQTES